MSINYTLWPNPKGPLGKNKVTIPDGINVTWPKGDALVGNFVYNEGKLVGFVDTMALVANKSNSTTIPYDFVDITVDKSLESSITFTPGERCKHLNISYAESGNTIVLGTKYLGCKTLNDIEAIDPYYKTNDIVDGVWSQNLADLEDGKSTNGLNEGIFYNCSNLITFISDLSSLENGQEMFSQCSNLATFTSNLRSLTDGERMFSHCDKFITFTVDLSSLTNGDGMFRGCINLTTFDSDLRSLTNGKEMFYGCTTLNSFSSDLRSLTDSTEMFIYCSNLTTFTFDLRSLTIGRRMFHECNNLTTFTSNLKSLTNGNGMFYGCKLDTNSVKNIAETIKDVSNLTNTNDCSDVWKTINIGIGNSSPNTEEDTAFRLMAEKGWTIYVNVDNNPSYQPDNLATLDENGEAFSAPIPFYAKPVQTDEKHAEYTDDEGNYFNILGGQFIYGDDISSYGMFTSLEDAAANMRLTKIEK